MSKKYKLAFLSLIVVGAIVAAGLYLHGRDIAVLNPKGSIGAAQRRLMIEATLLMLIVVIPVFILTAAIAWRYREGNSKAKYTPDWDHHTVLEFAWWALPMAIISVLAVVAWRASHELDPFKPVYAAKPPMTVQVVALDWKWLFMYPEQDIATVNYLEFPANTPINFEITSNGPMNSFWIPSLGGQIYAMAGMSTQLHLMANGVGSYNGVSANLSGRGFAGMKFTAVSASQSDFDSWVASVKRTRNPLSHAKYHKLAIPSVNNPVAYYSSRDPGLYEHIMMEFTMPADELAPLGSMTTHYGAAQ